MSDGTSDLFTICMSQLPGREAMNELTATLSLTVPRKRGHAQLHTSCKYLSQGSLLSPTWASVDMSALNERALRARNWVKFSLFITPAQP